MAGRQYWPFIFEPFISDLGLHHLISEAIHIMGDSKYWYWYIDIIFIDQPNLFYNLGFTPHCKSNVTITLCMSMQFKKTSRCSTGVKILGIWLALISKLKYSLKLFWILLPISYLTNNYGKTWAGTLDNTIYQKLHSERKQSISDIC